MHGLEQVQRHLDRHVPDVRQIGPRLLVVRLDRGVLLCEPEPESHVCIDVAVGHVMDDLSDGPAVRPVRRVELLVERPATARRSCAGAAAIRSMRCARSPGSSRGSNRHGRPDSEGPDPASRRVRYDGVGVGEERASLARYADFPCRRESADGTSRVVGAWHTFHWCTLRRWLDDREEETPTAEEAARDQVALLPSAREAGSGHGAPTACGQPHRRQALRHDAQQSDGARAREATREGGVGSPRSLPRGDGRRHRGAGSGARSLSPIGDPPWAEHRGGHLDASSSRGEAARARTSSRTQPGRNGNGPDDPSSPSTSSSGDDGAEDPSAA